MSCRGSLISEGVVERWQTFVDTISSLVSAPSVMINRLDPPDLEVFCSSLTRDNPFPTGTRMPLEGIYCEAAAKRRQRVVVSDAREDPEWAESPTAKAGIYSYIGYPLFWPDGSVFGTLCAVDTRGRNWGENTGKLLETFKDSIEAYLALAYANQAKSDFLASVSHEMRTPLTAILGFSELLIEGKLDAEQIDVVEIIRRNGEYLIQLINDILDLSKIEAGKLKVDRLPFSPCQTVCEVASLIRVRAVEKGLRLETQYDVPLPRTIYSDPVRLRQILINLAGNAVKFAETGTVRLAVRALDIDGENPKLQFDVIDSGVGIPEAQLSKLFEPFTQLEGATTREPGTGLGLAISKQLAQKLGGDLTVTSVPGQGSVFSLTIPTGPAELMEWSWSPCVARPSADAPKPSDAPITRLDSRVLLAEDAFDNQRLIELVLTKAGAEVVVADNGRSAYELALAARDAAQPFDVILMDMQMPVMDGYDATRRLRQAGYCGPIIALTANAMPTDRVRCLEIGCNDYATKPIDRNLLLSLVAKYSCPRVTESGSPTSQRP